MRVWRYLVVALLVGLPSSVWAQNGTVAPVPLPSYTDANGVICGSCLLYTYEAGTTTPLTTYQGPNIALAATHENPIELDAAGRPPAPIFLSANSYKFVLRTAGGTIIWTADTVSATHAAITGATNTGDLTFQVDTDNDGTNVFSFLNGNSTQKVVIEEDGDIQLDGSLTVGDATEADKAVLFDGNVQDFHVGVDDSADALVLGRGTVLGTTPAMTVASTGAIALTSDTSVTIDLDENNNGTETFDIRDGANTIVARVTEAGTLGLVGDITSSSTTFIITGAGDVVLDLDSDNNASNAFTIRNGTESAVFTVDESGVATASGGLLSTLVVSNADLAVHLDNDNNGTNTFSVLDGADVAVLSVTEAAVVTIGGTNATVANSGTGYIAMAANGSLFFDLDVNNDEVGVFNVRRGSDFAQMFTVDETGAAFVAGALSIGGIITSASVGTAALRTATGSFADTNGGDMTMNDYAFYPNIEVDNCTGVTNIKVNGSFANVADDTTATIGLTPEPGSCGAGNYDGRWRYITASDNPDIWVSRLIATGAITSVWEAEDPVEFPIAAAAGEDVVRLDVPSVAEIKRVYADLSPAMRKQAVSEFLAYLVKRGWAPEGLTFTVAIDQIPTRYQRAACMWAIRFIAQAASINPAELMLETMELLEGRITPKASYATVLDQHLTRRATQLGRARAEMDTHRTATQTAEQRLVTLEQEVQNLKALVGRPLADLIQVGAR